jgi:hypothetical protein
MMIVIGVADGGSLAKGVLTKQNRYLSVIGTQENQ